WHRARPAMPLARHRPLFQSPPLANCAQRPRTALLDRELARSSRNAHRVEETSPARWVQPHAGVKEWRGVRWEERDSWQPRTQQARQMLAPQRNAALLQRRIQIEQAPAIGTDECITAGSEQGIDLVRRHRR